MASYSQSNNANNFLTGNMDAVLGMIRTANITSFQLYFGVFIVQISDGVNSFELDLTGSGIAITGTPGAYVLSGTVTTAYLRMPGTGLSDRSISIQNFSASLADFFANPKALFSGNDFLTTGQAPNAFYGYGGNDGFQIFQNATGVATQDSLYGGAGDDTFYLTESGNTVETNPAIFGGDGRDRLTVDWLNMGGTAVLDSSRLTTTPTSVEVVQFSYSNYVYPTGFVYLNASITAAPGNGLLNLVGLEEIIDLQQITATAAGTIDLSSVAINSSSNTDSGDSVFRYFGSAGDDVFLGPESFGTATDIAYYGNGGNDTLQGSASGIETLYGGAGDDTYILGVNDVIIEDSGQGSDTLHSNITASLASFANVENLTLLGGLALNGTGNAQDNTITGTNAANVLDGGAGFDTMIGGAGNDTYVFDGLDSLTETATGGIDTINSSVTISLGVNPMANFENVVLTGTAAIDAGGNNLANRITGNSAANTLTGGIGNDTLTGGAGADILAGEAGDDTYVTDGLDTLIEAAGGGNDTVNSAATLTLAANLENLVITGAAAVNGTGNTGANRLTGNSAANVLDGGAGTDTLTGGEGADTLKGGAGDDFYFINGLDTLIEVANAGTDTVSAAATATLANNLENLVLTGVAAINGTGNALANRITGNGAANILTGGGEADTLIGGAGDDTYVTDGLDSLSEAANAGTDTVYASASITLAANLEHLVLTGTAAINGFGNTLANRLTGNNASNGLDGGAGADTLSGGVGDDTYLTDGLDTLIEAAGGGNDTVASTVSFTLAANFENLGLLGTAALSGTGNSVANRIVGNSGANVLNGGAGADTLNGGAGKDQLLGGTGADLFDFNLATESGPTALTADVISDFVQGQDKIDLSGIDAFAGTVTNELFVFRGSAAFSSTTQGEVRFQTVDLAGTADDHTLVFIDSDGDSGVEMAIRLTGLYTLTAADFVL